MGIFFSEEAKVNFFKMANPIIQIGANEMFFLTSTNFNLVGNNERICNGLEYCSRGKENTTMVAADKKNFKTRLPR